MLRVHHYIVSPVTLFRVLWRTHFNNPRICSHGSSSHHLRHLQPKTSNIYENASEQDQGNPGDPSSSPEVPQILHNRTGEIQETHTAGPRISHIPTHRIGYSVKSIFCFFLLSFHTVLPLYTSGGVLNCIRVRIPV